MSQQIGSSGTKNKTDKAIIRKLYNNITESYAETLVARAVFFSNLFSGVKKSVLLPTGKVILAVYSWNSTLKYYPETATTR